MQQNPVEPSFRVAPPLQPRARSLRTLRVILALILRETGTRETRTSLGFLWTFIEPIVSIAVLAWCFSLIQRQPHYGTSFVLFYVTGVMPYHLFTHVAGRVATSIRFSGNLLGFPSVTVIDVLMARFLLNLFTDISAFVLVLLGAHYLLGIEMDPSISTISMAIAMAAALALGVGTLNSVLFLASSAYESVWSLFMRPMSIFAGVMFPITDLPDFIFDWLKWIPMTHIVAESRHAFYPMISASFVSPAYVFGFAATCFVLGMVGLQRYVFDFLERR